MKKTTVEQCLVMSISNLTLKPGASGTLVWRGGLPVSEDSVGYSIDRDFRSLRLRYLWGDKPVDMTVSLTTTTLRNGGLRWWFVCPLMTHDTPCNRRVEKLYLPPGGQYFGCRHCYDLSYRSRQEYDKRYADVFRKAERRMDKLSASISQRMAVSRSDYLITGVSLSAGTLRCWF